MKNVDTQPKSVLITGATDGLGKALALLLAERGYRVFAAGRSAEKLARLDGIAREKNFALESVVLDVCSDSSVQSAIQAVLGKAGAIDVLVNNAGVNYTAAVEDLSMEDWRAQFETNFFGVLRVTRAVLPRMRERRSGRILMMSSLSGLMTPPTQGAYSSSKHALEGLSNALRMELYPFGIDVVLIEPGYIITGIQKAAAALSKPYLERGGPYAPLYAQFFARVNDMRSQSKTTPEDCARRKVEQAAADRQCGRRHAAAALWNRARKLEMIPFPLRVGNLKRQAVFAQLFPPFAPRFVQRTLRIIGGPLRAGKLNGVHAIKVADLVALRLQPDIFDARNFRGHGLDAGERLVFVVLRSGVLPFVNHDVDHALGLAKPVLRCNPLRVPVPSRHTTAKKSCRRCNFGKTPSRESHNLPPVFTSKQFMYTRYEKQRGTPGGQLDLASVLPLLFVH